MLQVCSGFEGVGSAGHFVWLIADDDEGALETMSAGGDAAWASIGGLPMAKGARTQIFKPPICSLHHEPIPKCIDSVSVFALALVPLFFFLFFVYLLHWGLLWLRAVRIGRRSLFCYLLAWKSSWLIAGRTFWSMLDVHNGDERRYSPTVRIHTAEKRRTLLEQEIATDTVFDV